MFHTCDRCESPATFHLTEIKDGDKSERHLCEECAKVLQVPQANKELQNLLKSFDPTQLSQQQRGRSPRVCPDCGMTYAEFRQNGRFGCPRDYEVFGEELVRLLERIHGGSSYSGMSPRRDKVISEGEVVDDLSRARAELRSAVEAENYEEAARLRDEIRRLEEAPPAEGGAS